MNSAIKPIVLTFIGHYLPGYKAGGILRVTVNTVDHLCDDFEFRIVTRDRDLGDDTPYADIKINQWQQVGNAMVYYLPPRSRTVKGILKLITGTPHHVLYLNSFFDPLTIKALWIRRLGMVDFKHVIVAPWGEFAWASLRQKYPKKFLFIQTAKVIGLYNNVSWRASSEFEKSDIIKVMKIKSDAIHVTGDFPIKNIPDTLPDVILQLPPDGEGLKVVFLSRISREKNLDYALRILNKVNARVVFDIYGPAENESYWKECQELISRLPANVKVNYHGRVDPNRVVHIFSHYDLFLFPTGGEAYGHVIAECLTSGTPVLLSTETPWRNLQADGLGWDVDLSQMDSFVEIIEKLALASDDERLKKRAIIKAKIMEHLLDPAVLEANRQLFLMGNCCAEKIPDSKLSI
jgi:glycosyltransferase involved in cell wall biosynthesis